MALPKHSIDLSHRYQVEPESPKPLQNVHVFEIEFVDLATAKSVGNG